MYPFSRYLCTGVVFATLIVSSALAVDEKNSKVEQRNRADVKGEPKATDTTKRAEVKAEARSAENKDGLKAEKSPGPARSPDPCKVNPTLEQCRITKGK